MRSHDLKIGFIGIGKMGKALALALAHSGYKITACHSRNVSSAEELISHVPDCHIVTTGQEVVNETDLVFITIPDDFIEGYTQNLLIHKDQAIVHCSGSLPRGILNNSNSDTCITGMFHPYQTLAGIDSPIEAVNRLSGITFAIDAEGWLLDKMVEFAKSLGSRTVRVAEENQNLYHASAVFTCGYLVTLLHCAVRLWEQMGHSEEEALQAILPLAHSTLGNVAKMGVIPSMTGPMYRGDILTVQNHISSLTLETPELVDTYTSLLNAARPIAKELGANASILSAFETLIKDTLERELKCAE